MKIHNIISNMVGGEASWKLLGILFLNSLETYTKVEKNNVSKYFKFLFISYDLWDN